MILVTHERSCKGGKHLEVPKNERTYYMGTSSCPHPPLPEGAELCVNSDEAQNFLSCPGEGGGIAATGSRFEYCAQDCVCVSTAGACADRRMC